MVSTWCGCHGDVVRYLGGHFPSAMSFAFCVLIASSLLAWGRRGGGGGGEEKGERGRISGEREKSVIHRCVENGKIRYCKQWTKKFKKLVAWAMGVSEVENLNLEVLLNNSLIYSQPYSQCHSMKSGHEWWYAAEREERSSQLTSLVWWIHSI